MIILFITVIIIAGTLYNIFIYKNRRRQIWINIGLIVLSILNIFLYFQASKNFIESNIALGAALSLVIPVLLILAIRGIMRDSKLVRSADRLR